MRYLCLGLMILLFLQTACDKTKDTPPVISGIEVVNHDSSGVYVKRGGTLSVDFDVLAQEGALLDYYHLEIHDHPASGVTSDEYKLVDESFYEQFQGLKNAHVHQHIQVPDTANLGEYHVVIMAVDKEGNSVSTEQDDYKIFVEE